MDLSEVSAGIVPEADEARIRALTRRLAKVSLPVPDDRNLQGFSIEGTEPGLSANGTVRQTVPCRTVRRNGSRRPTFRRTPVRLPRQQHRIDPSVALGSPGVFTRPSATPPSSAGTTGRPKPPPQGGVSATVPGRRRYGPFRCLSRGRFRPEAKWRSRRPAPATLITGLRPTRPWLPIRPRRCPALDKCLGTPPQAPDARCRVAGTSKRPCRHRGASRKSVHFHRSPRC